MISFLLFGVPAIMLGFYGFVFIGSFLGESFKIDRNFDARIEALKRRNAELDRRQEAIKTQLEAEAERDRRLAAMFAESEQETQTGPIPVNATIIQEYSDNTPKFERPMLQEYGKIRQRKRR